MEDEYKNTIPEQLTEQINLSYVRIIKTYLQLHNKYKQFKFRNNDEELKKFFHLFDQYFYDNTGKINRDNIRSLMPPNLEKNIKEKYSMLSDNEIHLCYLILFNVSVSEITDILPFTQNSIYVITNRIKRKTGMKNIKDSLKTLVVT